MCLASVGSEVAQISNLPYRSASSLRAARNFERIRAIRQSAMRQIGNLRYAKQTKLSVPMEKMKKTKRTTSAKELPISRRDLLKGALALGAGAAVGGCVTGTPTSQLRAKTEHPSDLVRRENEQTGT